MSTVALNNLLAFIESMGLSDRNRKWLAEKLIEPTKAGKAGKEASMVRDSFSRAMQEVTDAGKKGEELQSLDSLIDELETA